MRRIVAVLITVVLGSLVVAACSSHDDRGMNMHTGDRGHGSSGMTNNPVAPGARVIDVTADALTFVPKDIEIPAGEDVTINLTSVDLEHDFSVQGVGHIVHADAGTSAQGGLSIDKPGSYTFWCTVTGHKQGGMVGTLTVT